MGRITPPQNQLPALASEQAVALYARVQAGDADARADAHAAADRGEFGIILTGNRTARAIGLACSTPYGRPPRVLAELPHGDVYDDAVMRWSSYARTYNRALVDRPDYPAPDLCRTISEEEERSGFEPPLDRDARAVAAPPATIYQAARRGTRVDVERLLVGTDPDAPDSLGMTPLAWAVARSNAQAIDALLAACANPWIGAPEYRTGAVYWAAALGRGDLFERLVGRPGRPFERWSAIYQAAAVSSGEVAIIEHMLAEPHEPFRLESISRRSLPAAAMFEPVLRRDRALADRLLARAVESEPRLDLIRLSLRHGADPNTVSAYETVLGVASRGIHEGSVEIVDLLLQAGADPNRPSHRTRPIWNAVTSMRIDLGRGEWTGRARAIFHRLLAAGADLNLPDDQGRPPVSFVLFPMRNAHWELEAGFPPELLELLVARGMDVNARWEGRRVLPAVEEQAGRDSALAVTLRRLGARH
ncbi:MAG TPA: hypothetical protein VF603_12130 [Allosphingosinicella sp.]